MTCASCVGRVERALQAAPGVTAAAINLATETASIVADGSTGAMVLADVLAKAGYPARVAQPDLLVADMTCASGVGRVERALAAVPGVVSAQVNLATEAATLRYLQGQITPAALIAASGGGRVPGNQCHPCRCHRSRQPQRPRSASPGTDDLNRRGADPAGVCHRNGRAHLHANPYAGDEHDRHRGQLGAAVYVNNPCSGLAGAQVLPQRLRRPMAVGTRHEQPCRTWHHGGLRLFRGRNLCPVCCLPLRW